MNIQILNIKTGTIKIKKQLAYTKTLQMALHTNMHQQSRFFFFTQRKPAKATTYA